MPPAAPPAPSAPYFLEDLAPGQRFLSRTEPLTAEAITAFGALYDPQPFHTDPDAAAATFFNGLTASGFHTAAITMRLVVETFPVAGGLIGAGGEIAWPAPARPGDALQAEIEILDIAPSRSRPDRGSAFLSITTRNQAGTVLQTFKPRVLLFRRGSAPPLG
jgi:acyl dehydratase